MIWPMHPDDAVRVPASRANHCRPPSFVFAYPVNRSAADVAGYPTQQAEAEQQQEEEEDDRSDAFVALLWMVYAFYCCALLLSI
jgi:hypothetical protein